MKRMILVCWLCLAATSVYAEGGWVADKKTGCQFWIPENSLANISATWSGECKNGKAYGDGELKWNTSRNKTVLTGFMESGMCSRNCSLVIHGGNKYSGDFQQNIPSGDVTIIFQDGSKYIGKCKNGLPSGEGIHTGIDYKYSGEWQSGKPNGKGTVSSSVSNYTGDWKNGVFDGNGVIIYPNGDKYSGGWSEGKEHGKGKYTFKDGNSYEGLWEHGERIKIF